MKARKARPARAHSVRDAAGALLLHPREDVQMFHVKHRGASAQLAASLNGKKASNSEEILRLDRVRRKAARKSTLTTRRYAQRGLSFALAIRAGDSEFDAFLPFAALSAAKPGSTAPPHAASPVGRLAIGRDERLSDGRGGLPSSSELSRGGPTRAMPILV